MGGGTGTQFRNAWNFSDNEAETNRASRKAENHRGGGTNGNNSCGGGTGKQSEDEQTLQRFDQAQPSHRRERENQPNRGKWEGWRRNCIAGVEEFDGVSIFNKQKWLPLCQETQFKISHKCCSVMKKSPLRSYQRRTKRFPFLGTLAEESKLRTQAWVRNGCNAFDAKEKTSQPMSFWTEQDVLKYIRQEGLKIASVYGEILAVDDQGFAYEPLPGIDCKLKCTDCQRTGCIFCGFGAHLDKEPRFVRLAKTHPKQYEYCMRGGQWVDNPDYDPTAPEYDGEWKNWNPKKIWTPSKEGLGMKKVFDDVNAIYGKDFIKYE